MEAATLAGCSRRTVQRALDENMAEACAPSDSFGTFPSATKQGGENYAPATSEGNDFPWRRHRGPDVSCVYFVQEREDGPIKIGVSTAYGLAARVSGIQNGNSRALILRRVVRGDYGTEAALHERFAQHRIRGEWFAPHPDVVAAATPAPIDHDMWESWSSDQAT